MPPDTSNLGFNVFVLDKEAIKELRKFGRSFSEVRREVSRLNGQTATVRVDAQTARARANINQLISRLDRIAGRRLLINVAVAGAPAILETMAAIAGATAALGAAATAAGASLGAFGAVAAPMLADVKDTAEDLADNTTAHEEAVSALQVAQKEYNQLGTEETLDRVKDAQEELADVERERKVILGTLEQEQRGFVKQLAKLQNAWKDLQDSLSGDVFRVATAGLKAAAVLLGPIEQLARAAVTPLELIAKRLREFGKSEQFKEFINTLTEFAPGQIVNLAAVFINLSRAAMGLIRAFIPLGGDASNALVQFTERFADWAEQLRTDPAFRQFVARLRQNAPLIRQTLADIGQLMLDFGRIMAQIGPEMLAVIQTLVSMTQRFLEAHPRIARFLAIMVVSTAAVRAIIGPLRTLVITARAVGGAAVFLFRGMKFLKTGLKVVISGFRGLLVVFRLLRVAFATNPIGLIITALVGLGVALVTAYRKSETFRNIVNTALRAIASAGKWMWNTVLKPVFNFLKNAFTGGANRARFLSQIIRSAFQRIAKFIGTAINFVRKHFKTLLLFIGPAGWIVRAILFLRKNWRQIWNAVVATLVNSIRLVIGGLRNLRNRVVGWAKGAIRWLVDTGKDIIRGLQNGVSNAIKGIKGWLRNNVWDPIVRGVKALFGISSPSSVFADMGFDMIRGLIKGLIQGNPARFIHNIFGGVTDSAMKALRWLLSQGRVALGSLGDLASDVLGRLADLFGGGAASGANQALGRQMAAALGWVGAQWRALRELWTRESGWRHTARNPTSGAYGIPQALPPTKMASAGADWRTNPATQIEWGLGYIARRYGSPLAALRFHDRHNWYARGSFDVPETGPAVVHSGEMILPARLAEAVRGALGGGGGREVHVNVGPVMVSDAADVDMLANRLAFDLKTASF